MQTVHEPIISTSEDILEYMPQGVMILDADMVVRFWNTCMADWTGLPRERTVGQPVSSLFPAFGTPRYTMRLAPIFDGGPPTVFSSQLHPHLVPCPLPSGRQRILHTVVAPVPAGQAYHALFVAQDVTSLADAIQKKERAHAALRESERVLAKAQAIARIGSWTYDRASGEVRWSDELFRILDLSPSRAVPCLEALADRALHERDREEILTSCREPDSWGETVPPLDFPIQRPSGETRFLRLHVEPIRDTTGRVMGAVGTVQDVTAQVRAEGQRRCLEERIQQNRRYESLGVMAGGIAHDFNNLLMGVLGNAQLLGDRVNEDPTCAEFIHAIQDAGGRAAELASQMLAYSGRSQISLKPIDMNKMAGDLDSVLHLAVPATITASFDLSPDPVKVIGDMVELRQITMNLVRNAAEAIGAEPGRIVIRTGRRLCDDDFLRRSVYYQGQRAGWFGFVEVEDTGHGIEESMLDSIFDPFFTTKFTGRGLGLAATIGVVRGHDGAITVTSTPQKGSTFQILIPACIEAKAPERAKRRKPRKAAAGTPARPAEQALQTKRAVLVVDDEPMIRKLASRVLTKFGLEVVLADNGEQGIEVFEKHRDRIGLILMDVAMPKLDGVQSLRCIREMDKEVAAVLLTGFNAAESARGILDLNLLGSLQKPFSQERFREILCQARLLPEEDS